MAIDPITLFEIADAPEAPVKPAKKAAAAPEPVVEFTDDEQF